MADFYTDIYNKEIKERFLDSIDLTKYPPRWWERVFEKTYFFENNKSKDLYSFTVPEILEFYKFLDIGTIAPLIVYNTNLLLYAQWALNENLIFDGQNHFDGLDIEILSTCINNAKTDRSILSYDTFKRLVSKEIINEQDRFLFFCLFEGIKGKDFSEIINLKISDIDEQNRIAHLVSGRDVPVSQDFINICILANQQTEYIGLTDLQRVIYLKKDITIFKPKQNSNNISAERNVYTSITRNIKTLDKLNDAITPKSIKDSGLIYYLNKRADELNISTEELLYSCEKCQDIIDKYQFNIHVRKRWILQYKNLLH